MANSLLTVVIAATAGKYMTWATKLAHSIYCHAPDMPVVVYPYEDPANRMVRFQCLRESRTPYTLHLEADSVAAGDVRPLGPRIQQSGKQLLSTSAWNCPFTDATKAQYAAMFAAVGLPLRTYIGPHFVIETRLVAAVLSDMDHWFTVAAPYAEQWYHTFPLALALAAAGVGDEQTLYLGNRLFSFGDAFRAQGVVHHWGRKHMSGAAQSVEKAIERRRRLNARSGKGEG